MLQKVPGPYLEGNSNDSSSGPDDKQGTSQSTWDVWQSLALLPVQLTVPSPR